MMTIPHGFVVANSMIKIVDHGSSAERFNILLLSEGYQSDELGTFERDADHFVERLQQTAPFDDMWSALNLYRVNVASTDSLAIPPGVNGWQTYFKATFHKDNIYYLFLGEGGGGLAHEVANNQLQNSSGEPVWHVIVIIVNAPQYGGSGGGNIAVYATADGFHANGADVGIHELAHTFNFGLTDEYYSEDSSPYNSNDPRDEPNVARTTLDAQRKWGSLMSAGVLPTTQNCPGDSVASDTVAPDTVGAFEGAHHHKCGLFRPQATCHMREIGKPFCIVCQRRIKETLSLFQ